MAEKSRRGTTSMRKFRSERKFFVRTSNALMVREPRDWDTCNVLTAQGWGHFVCADGISVQSERVQEQFRS